MSSHGLGPAAARPRTFALHDRHRLRSIARSAVPRVASSAHQPTTIAPPLSHRHIIINVFIFFHWSLDGRAHVHPNRHHTRVVCPPFRPSSSILEPTPICVHNHQRFGHPATHEYSPTSIPQEPKHFLASAASMCTHHLKIILLSTCREHRSSES